MTFPTNPKTEEKKIMTYCGFCGNSLQQGNYCGHCGRPRSQGTTQVQTVSPTVLASPPPPTQISMVNQERELAYQSLCQQYESESATVIVARTKDDQIGMQVYITPEDTWIACNQHKGIVKRSEYTRHRPVGWQSVGSQTIAVAIFKSSSTSVFSAGAYIIWMDKPLWRRILAILARDRSTSRRISVIENKVTFVDLR